MNFRDRPYEGSTDQSTMLALARGDSDHHFRVIDLPYRLSSWALDDPANAHLWFDRDGELAAWVVMQSPFWQVDITCRPDCVSVLYSRLLEWADRRARELENTAFFRDSWSVAVFNGQAAQIAELELHDYVDQSNLGEDSWNKVLMRRITPEPPRLYSPPSGYTVRALRGADEVEAYVELHRAVFGSRNMTVEWRARTLQHPDYEPELDIVVEAPDGRLGAFCIGWLHNGVGQIEPLGCHADYRRFALGRVALSEVLNRLVNKGAASILVETDNYRDTAFRLYESFDFEVIQKVLLFSKDYP